MGYEKAPTFTASSQLLVGNLSISDPSAIPGAVGASRSLADVYARLINANDVQEQVAKETVSSPDTAIVTATPVVESPLVRVTATSDSEEGAIAYANAAAGALSDYVNNLKSPGSEVDPVAKRYRAAALVYTQKLDTYKRFKDKVGMNPTPTERLKLNEADSEVQTAKLKRTALGAIYQRGQNIRVAQPSLNTFVTASAASNDRNSTMQITGGIGLAAGVVLGAALALLRTNRRVGRPSS